MLNHIFSINLTLNEGKYDANFLDIYSKEGGEDEIIMSLINEGFNLFDLYPQS